MILLPQLHVWYLHTISAYSLGLGQACGWTCLTYWWFDLACSRCRLVSVCVYAYVCFMCVRLGWSLVPVLFIFPPVPIACNLPKSLGHLGPPQSTNGPIWVPATQQAGGLSTYLGPAFPKPFSRYKGFACGLCKSGTAFTLRCCPHRLR